MTNKVLSSCGDDDGTRYTHTYKETLLPRRAGYAVCVYVQHRSVTLNLSGLKKKPTSPNFMRVGNC